MAARSALITIALIGLGLVELRVGDSPGAAQTSASPPAAKHRAAGPGAGHAKTPAKSPHKALPAKVAAVVPAVKPFVLNPTTLPAVLRTLGYTPQARDPYQRLSVDEGAYVYTVDLSFSKSGDWLMATANLAPIPDLTKVPAAPLLTLLAQNDFLLGMYFSYDQKAAQILLSASVPVRALTPASVKSMVEGMKQTVRSTQDLWNAAKW